MFRHAASLADSELKCSLKVMVFRHLFAFSDALRTVRRLPVFNLLFLNIFLIYILYFYCLITVGDSCGGRVGRAMSASFICLFSVGYSFVFSSFPFSLSIIVLPIP